MTDREARRRFVREVLGCGCPDELVERTEPLVGRASELPGVSGGLDVGGRLLVLHCPVAPSGLSETAVERLFAAAVAARERDGFNRVRIVLSVHDPGPLAQEMRPTVRRLEESAAADGRAHLHVIDRRAWPG